MKARLGKVAIQRNTFNEIYFRKIEKELHHTSQEEEIFLGMLFHDDAVPD